MLDSPQQYQLRHAIGSRSRPQRFARSAALTPLRQPGRCPTPGSSAPQATGLSGGHPGQAEKSGCETSTPWPALPAVSHCPVPPVAWLYRIASRDEGAAGNGMTRVQRHQLRLAHALLSKPAYGINLNLVLRLPDTHAASLRQSRWNGLRLSVIVVLLSRRHSRCIFIVHASTIPRKKCLTNNGVGGTLVARAALRPLAERTTNSAKANANFTVDMTTRFSASSPLHRRPLL
jgi:hypothetical protein